MPPTPRGLSARSRRRWSELHDEFDLSLAASALLEEALLSLDLAAECRAHIARDGVLVPGRYDGVPRAHPMLAAHREAVRTAERIYARLGLNLADDAGTTAPAPVQRPRPGGPGLRAVGDDEP